MHYMKSVQTQSFLWYAFVDWKAMYMVKSSRLEIFYKTAALNKLFSESLISY